MKRFNSIIAIIGLAIVAIAVAFVSCKKETEKDLSQKDYTIQQVADVRQIEDITSYLKDFKKKLTESKSDEAYTLEDAAWHLASLANLDFCKVNVDYDNVQFDTVEMQVNVTDGVVLLSDLNTAYEQMCTTIQHFKKKFNQNNQNLYYINMSIGADGNAEIAFTTSFNICSKDIWDHTWYFDDDWDAIYSFYDYFSDDSTYYWNTTAARELQRGLNLVENHQGIVVDSLGTTMNYYIPTRSYIFDYNNTYDPYQSDFYNDSRVFAKVLLNNFSTNYIMEILETIYCFDSYLGLGYDYIYNSNERIICWKITPFEYYSNNKKYIYHQLKVEYGRLASINPNPYD